MQNQTYLFIGKVLAKLGSGRRREKIFKHTYLDFVRGFRKAALRIGLRRVVPYQCRHSGASIDRANKHRCMMEVKKRGRWRSDSSIARYEKAGRLAQVQSDMQPHVLDFCRVADKHLEELVLGRCLAALLPRVHLTE